MPFIKNKDGMYLYEMTGMWLILVAIIDNNLSRLKWWHDSTWTKAPLKWIWPPIMLICTATWEWSSQPRNWLNLFPHLDHEVDDLNLRSLSWLSSRWTRRRRRRRVDSFPRSCSSKAGSGSSPRSRQTVSEKRTSFGIGCSKMNSETSHLDARGSWKKKEKWWQWLYWC